MQANCVTLREGKRRPLRPYTSFYSMDSTYLFELRLHKMSYKSYKIYLGACDRVDDDKVNNLKEKAQPEHKKNSMSGL